MIRRALLATAVLTAAVWMLLSPVGAQGLDDVTVTIDPTQSSVVLGESVDLVVTVINSGDGATAPGAVHLDITDPTSSRSTDPEDWTSTLTRSIGRMDPGTTRTVSWTIQPISPGSYTTYAVVLSTGSETIVASNALRIDVEDERSLNPGGILPVAIGAPVFVGGLFVWQLTASRRRGVRSGDS